MTVESVAAYKKLQEDSKSILDGLKAQGLTVDNITISIASSDKSDQTGTQGNNQQNQQAQQQGQQAAAGRNRDESGIQLGIIRDAMADLPQDRVATAADWRRFSQSWREMLQLRINSLIMLRDQLTGCIGCGCLSLDDCPLRNPNDVLADDGAGPRRLVSAE